MGRRAKSSPDTHTAARAAAPSKRNIKRARIPAKTSGSMAIRSGIAGALYNDGKRVKPKLP